MIFVEFLSDFVHSFCDKIILFIDYFYIISLFICSFPLKLGDFNFITSNFFRLYLWEEKEKKTVQKFHASRMAHVSIKERKLFFFSIKREKSEEVVVIDRTASNCKSKFTPIHSAMLLLIIGVHVHLQLTWQNECVPKSIKKCFFFCVIHIL